MLGYDEFGTGPTKVIGLHGWFGDQRTFATLAQSLDPVEYHVVLVAHRGYGASREIPGDHTMAEMAADVLDLADHLGWSRFSVLGHSMGGKAAQLLAGTAADRVDRLVVVASAPAGPVPFDYATRGLFEAVAHDPESRRAVIDHSTGGRLSPVWIDRLVRDSIARSTPEVQASYLRSWADDDLTPAVKGCPVPVLALAGEHDPVGTAEASRYALSGLFDDLRVESLGNSGHYPMDEVPLAMGALVAGFLHGNGASG